MDSNDFQLKPVNSYFCDLKLLVTKKKRDGSVVEEWSDAIYGIPLLIAMRTITTYRTSKKFDKTSLSEFLKAWKKEFDLVQKKVCILTKSSDWPQT